MDKKNRKRDGIIETGRVLFWIYGIQRVTVEEICVEAEVSKMTFYKYFNNKTNLVICIIENLYQDQVKTYREFWESDLPMEEKVRRTIQLKQEFARNVSFEFIRDIYKSGDTDLQDYFSKKTQESLHMMRQDYLEAQQKGMIRKDLSIDFILYILNHLSEMISDEKLQSLYTQSSDLIHELLGFFYYGILPRKN